MYTQFVAILLHLVFNYIFVNVYQMGVIGTGISGSLTNLFILLANTFMLYRQTDLKEVLDVSIFDK